MFRPGEARSSARRVLCALGLALCVSAVPVLASGPRLSAPRQKNLAENTHFGTYYVPKIFASGRNLFAMWRSPGQSGAVRSFAVSRDGGKTFSEPKTVRPPLVTQLLDVEADGTGSIYFVGLTPLATQVAIVRTDEKLKTFNAGLILESERNVVEADLKTASDGRLFLAFQTAFSINIRAGVFTTAQQTLWAVSADHGESFSTFVVSNSRPGFDSDYAPRLVAGPGGEMWLLTLRDATRTRYDAGESYNGGRLLVRRIDGDPTEPIDLARTAELTGQPTQIEGFIAADGSLCVAWAEQALVDGAPIQRVYLTRNIIGGPPVVPVDPLVTTGIPHDFHIHRTDAGQVVILVHGAGYDSDEPEPNLIGLASIDDAISFGPIAKITGYPPLTSVDSASDGKRVYGLWTDTRLVRFSAFVPRDQ